MPDTSGKLQPVDYVKIKAWWDKNWKGSVTCPVCKSDVWNTAPFVVQTPRHGIDWLQAGATISYIAVTCEVCAYTMLFNSVRIGLSPVRENPEITGPDIEAPEKAGG